MLLDSYAAAELNDIGVHILRSGLVHSLRMRLRAQEWIRRHPEIADERIDAPIVVVGMMRSGTTLLQRLLAADTGFTARTAGRWSRSRPSSDYDWSAREDPRIAISESARSDVARAGPGTVRDPPDVRPRGRGGDRLPRRRVPVARAGVRRARAGVPGVDRRPGLRAGLRVPAPDAAVPAVAEAAARRARPRARWVLKSPAHLGYLDALRDAVPRSARRAHAPRPAGRRSRRAPASTRRCTRCTPTTSTCTGSAPVARADGLDQRPGDGRRATGWADEAARCTDIEFADAVADPIGQVARVYDAIGLPLTDRGRVGHAPAGWPSAARACAPAVRSRRTSG